MTPADIVQRRLRNQRLVGAGFGAPEDVVGWFGAVQAQDYAGAKWGVGQRTRTCSDADVEQALVDGRILRTHVLRPTWHFATPADIRWMLKLTAPRVHAASAYYYGQQELTAATFRRTDALLAKAVEGGRHRTREELARVLTDAGIRAAGIRLAYLVMHAELEGVLVSGPRRGKQFTYALLDERAPASKPLDRDEALVELGVRYFTSHGPALAQDFAWWSGLTVADAKRAVELAGKRLQKDTIDDKTYWSAPASRKPRTSKPTAHLLPNYDEYVIAYKDHGPLFDPAARRALQTRTGVLSAHLVVLNGKVIGGFRRTLKKDAVLVQTALLVRPTPRERAALKSAATRYAKFLSLSAHLV